MSKSKAAQQRFCKHRYVMGDARKAMKRIMLTVAYDGTNYCGWQLQPEAPTVEGELNRCLSELLKEDIHVIGASRTDSGVHASGAVAVFDTETRIPPEKLAYAVNRGLPEDIRVVASMEVSPDFHPRRTNCRKTYEYRIWHADFPMPTQRLYTHWVYTPLDLKSMQEAAAFLVGEHDFKSFCSVHTQAESTVRTIYHIEVEEHGHDLRIRVCGNGFLYNMIRIIAGTLIEVGQGKYPPQAVKEMLEAKERQKSGPTAPAKGLTLIGYEWEDERFSSVTKA